MQSTMNPPISVAASAPPPIRAPITVLRQRQFLDQEDFQIVVNVVNPDGSYQAFKPHDNDFVKLIKNPGEKKGFRMAIAGKLVFGCPSDTDMDADEVMALLGIDEMVSSKQCHPKGKHGWIYCNVYFSTHEGLQTGDYTVAQLRRALLAQRNDHTTTFNQDTKQNETVWGAWSDLEGDDGMDPRLFEEVEE
jgi:hypothetical protein